MVVCMTEESRLRTGERGACANVPATRATQARPEAPFIIEHREPLRYFAHTGETNAQIGALAVALGLMFEVLKPLGQLVTRLPVVQEHAERTTGPSLELFLSEILTPIGASLSKFGGSLASGGSGIAA
jgi:hypothetical protein